MQKKEKIIQRQTLEKKGKKFKNLKLQIKREIIVQKNSKNKIKAYLVIYECWTMCYERSLNLHTYKKKCKGKYQFGIPNSTNKTQKRGIKEQQT
jgi:hypothetical protein